MNLPAFAGANVAVLATGPSLTPEAAASVRGMPSIAVADAYRRAPWASALYAHDAMWWDAEGAAQDFAGTKLCSQVTRHAMRAPSFEERVELRPGRVVHLRSSGLAAIRLAAAAGAKKITVLGFDAHPGHFEEGLHKPPRKAPERDTYAAWAIGLDNLIAELRSRGIEIVRGGELPPDLRTPLDLTSMGGLGDMIHLRGVLPGLLRHHNVYLSTPYRAVFHDMPDLLIDEPAPGIATRKYCAYTRETVKRAGSVLGAMAASCGIDAEPFALPVPDEWRSKARELINWDGPFTLFRPIVERAVRPLLARHPDPIAYRAIFEHARGRGFSVAVANVTAGYEKLLDDCPDVDLGLCEGTTIEELIGLFAEASLVVTTPGMGTILAQAVGTPCITVFGGFEDASSYSAGATDKWLAIEPDAPCACWKPLHECDKRIDLERAFASVDAFLEANA